MTVVGTPGGDPDSPIIYVELNAVHSHSDWTDDDVREGRAQRLVESTRDVVGDAVELARACAAKFGAGLRELPGEVPVPDQVELQLGITLDSEVGAVLAKAKASAQLQLTLRWTNGTGT